MLIGSGESPPVTYFQVRPTRNSSMIPVGAVAYWQLITNAFTPPLFKAPVVLVKFGAERLGAGAEAAPKVFVSGLIQRLTLVTTPTTCSYEPTINRTSPTL